MTNMERLHELNREELAWFLMAYSDGCRCCIHKQLESDNYWHRYGCKYDSHDDTCIVGYQKWLDREPDEDDDWMFRVCKNNDIITRWNAMNVEFKDGLKLRYENGLAVGIEQDHEPDLEDQVLPFK